MHKTLFLTVGTGRNRQDIAAALAFSVQQCTPDRVVFFCSEKTAAETMPEVRAHLAWDAARHEVVEHNGQDDVQRLYAVYLDRLRPAAADGEVWVDFTSGTKAMSAALFAAGIAVEAREVRYVTGPRDETGRVIRSERVLALQPAEIIAERQLARARELFNLGYHAAAVRAVDTLRRTLPRESALGRRARTIHQLGTAYSLWDRFQWDQAARELRQALKPQEGLGGFDAARVQANADFVQAVYGNPYGPERMVDLLANVARCQAQERFDDALARLYRATEYLLQWRLQAGWGIDTGAVDVTAIAGKLGAETRQRLEARAAGGKVKLGLNEALELLAELGDPVGGKLVNGLYYKAGAWRPGGPRPRPEDSGPLQGALSRRNNSWLAHGTQPAKEDTVKVLLNTVKDLLASPEAGVSDLDHLSAAAEMVRL